MVEELAFLRRLAGQHVWFDQWELVPGENWKDAIAAAIRRSSAVVVCIGPSVASAWQEEELRFVWW